MQQVLTRKHFVSSVGRRYLDTTSGNEYREYIQELIDDDPRKLNEWLYGFIDSVFPIYLKDNRYEARILNELYEHYRVQKGLVEFLSKQLGDTIQMQIPREEGEPYPCFLIDRLKFIATDYLKSTARKDWVIDGESFDCRPHLRNGDLPEEAFARRRTSSAGAIKLHVCSVFSVIDNLLYPFHTVMKRVPKCSV